MANEFNETKLNGVSYEDNNTAIDMSDILTVCKQFSQLGWQIQRQLEGMMENGIEEAVASGQVSIEALPSIRAFLKMIGESNIFGEACDQSFATMMMLDNYEAKHPEVFMRNKN